MVKTLSASIEDVEKANNLTISGTRHENQFNENIVLSVGSAKIVINSRELAEALAAVVDFQTPPKQETKLHTIDLYDGKGMLNLGEV